jgi:hypothetical protein
MIRAVHLNLGKEAGVLQVDMESGADDLLRHVGIACMVKTDVRMKGPTHTV